MGASAGKVAGGAAVDGGRDSEPWGNNVGVRDILANEGRRRHVYREIVLDHPYTMIDLFTVFIPSVLSPKVRQWYACPGSVFA